MPEKILFPENVFAPENVPVPMFAPLLKTGVPVEKLGEPVNDGLPEKTRAPVKVGVPPIEPAKVPPEVRFSATKFAVCEPTV